MANTEIRSSDILILPFITALHFILDDIRNYNILPGIVTCLGLFYGLICGAVSKSNKRGLTI